MREYSRFLSWRPSLCVWRIMRGSYDTRYLFCIFNGFSTLGVTYGSSCNEGRRFSGEAIYCMIFLGQLEPYYLILWGMVLLEANFGWTRYWEEETQLDDYKTRAIDSGTIDSHKSKCNRVKIDIWDLWRKSNYISKWFWLRLPWWNISDMSRFRGGRSHGS